jgi:hypothetical protein
MAGKRLFAALAAQQQDGKEKGHKFDEDFRTLTYRQFGEMQARPVVELARALEEEMGKEKCIAFLKKVISKQMLKRGQMQAAMTKDQTLQGYVTMFKDPMFQKFLTFDIVEDTDTAFEINVTECLSASAFLKQKAGDIGHAFVCWGDYAWAEGFNEKIKLVRDKTLMQGDACCNHRYIWTG